MLQATAFCLPNAKSDLCHNEDSNAPSSNAFVSCARYTLLAPFSSEAVNLPSIETIFIQFLISDHIAARSGTRIVCRSRTDFFVQSQFVVVHF